MCDTPAYHGKIKMHKLGHVKRTNRTSEEDSSCMPTLLKCIAAKLVGCVYKEMPCRALFSLWIC